MSVKYNNIIPKIAVVGCGNWGKNLIRVFHELEVLYAVCDIEPTKATYFSERYAVPRLTLEQILNADEIDGIVIATPSVTHYELGLSCLKANKHVYIEKPLALEVNMAITLKQTAELQQRILMVGHLLQYHHAFQTIKKLKEEGILGDLQYISSHRSNFGKFRAEENVLWDYAPHDVSMILAMVGELPEKVLATSANHLMHTSADSTHIHLNFHSNIKAHIFVSWLYPFKEQKLTIIGSKAMVIFNDCLPWESKLQLHSYPDEWVDGLPRPFTSEFKNIHLEQSEPLLNECRHFLDCILQHAEPQTGATEGIKVMSVLEAAALSMATQHFVTLPASYSLPELSKQIDITKKKVLEETFSN